jgi:uroporphyrinogen-III synthase
MLGNDAPVILSAESTVARGPSPERPRPLIACIGPITAATATELGLHVDVVATEYTVPGLVAALNEYTQGDGNA